jgi:prepilin-type N-terminal cleavage/methylation domain-containing protein
LPRIGRGFTLIEVLVVVAIIALLIAILLPSLARAREQARTARCLANMSNLPKAALMFAQSHGGFSQLIGQASQWEGQPSSAAGPSWGNVDPNQSRYDYQTGYFGATGRYLKPWPVALADTLGNKSLKRAEQYFEQTAANITNPAHFKSRYGAQDVFMCPSDREMVHNVWSPVATSSVFVLGLVSYAINEDIFGVNSPSEQGCWKDGGPTTFAAGPKAGAERLAGRLDKIQRPSEVAMFSDGGEEGAPKDPSLLLSCPFPSAASSINGPFLENMELAWGRIPHRRHSNDGGVSVALADGSGKYTRPIAWVTLTNPRTRQLDRFVLRYSQRIRISPYNAGPLPAAQP